MRLCSIEGCRFKHDSKGFCSLHYQRFKRYGDPLFLKAKQPHRKRWLHHGKRSCKVAKCPRAEALKGVCHLCYKRALRLGVQPKGWGLRRLATKAKPGRKPQRKRA